MPSSPINETLAPPLDPESPASSALHFYLLRVRDIKHETRDAVTVTFDVPPELDAKFRFIQGQYLTLRARINGEEVRRSYSIASAVHDGLLRVVVKRTPGGVFSNWVIDNVKPGDELEVMPPLGRFHVPLAPHNQKHYVAFAAGSGITPIFSIIKTTLLTEPDSSFTLFYGNRSSSTVIFREELAELKDLFMDRFSLVHILSREHQDVDIFNGRINAQKAEELLRRLCPLEQVDTIFLCGPQEMIENVSAKLKSLGFPASRIKIELFTVDGAERENKSKAAATTDTAEADVTLTLDGVQHRFSMEKRGETVLDAGLRRGIDLPHSCKSGICATCRAKLVSGQVDMDVHYALEDYEIAQGFILTCQSHPVTDNIVVDFDQHN